MSDCRDATMPLYLELGDNDGGIQGVDVNGQPLTPDAAGHVNVPVPTKTSELENDSDYQTSEEVKASLETLAEDLRGEMPTRTSELQNDSDYQTGEDVAAAITAEAPQVYRAEGWIIKKYQSGFFEAFYVHTDTFADIKNQKGQVWESERIILPFPSIWAEVIPVPNYDEIYVGLTVSSRLFATWGNVYGVSSAGIDYSVLSALKRGQQSSMRLDISLIGYAEAADNEP